MVTFKMGSSVICLSYSYSISNNVVSCERLLEFYSRIGVQTTQIDGIWVARKLAQIVKVQTTSRMKLPISVRYNGLIKIGSKSITFISGICAQTKTFFFSRFVFSFKITILMFSIGSSIG
jgi:hypothetical protein